MKRTLLLVCLLAPAGVLPLPAASTKAGTAKKPAIKAANLAAAVAFPAAGAAHEPAFVGAQPEVVRSSASYSVVTESLDQGGVARLTSASYGVEDASIGGVGALAASATYTTKGGYAGQLYEVRGLAVTSAAASVNEGSSVQLGAAPTLDDGTLLTALAAGAVSWSVVSGPVVSVSAAGVATAGTVYQNTPATVQATAGGLSGTGVLMVINVNHDDYESYAGDGIDDAWQAQYFGVNNPKAGPNVDADGTGQSNLFKYLAGLNPLDPTSHFALSIAPVVGQPGQKTLTFSPVYAGRTYTVQATSSLMQPNWTALAGATVSINGTTGTVTDSDASTTPRFYRIQISMP